MSVTHQDKSSQRLSESELVEIFAHANGNVLRAVLYYLTGDHELTQIESLQEERRGGAFIAQVLRPEDERRVHQLAAKFWLEHGSDVHVPNDLERARVAIEILHGRKVSDTEFRLGCYQLQLNDETDGDWSPQALERTDDQQVLIVGGGVSGIGMAVKLEKMGLRYSLIESQSRLGGTWERNQFPEARVDTSSFVYQYSFVKHYRWSEQYAEQSEVREYLNHVADTYGVTANIRLQTTLEKARFDLETGRWWVTLSDAQGNRWEETPTAIISAAGLFSAPRFPDIDGLETFAGDVVHSAAWDAQFDPTDRRIAIIGNGSTGVQIMPWLARKASHLSVVQRTPQWISPMEGYRAKIAAEVRWMHDNMPLYWLWSSYGDRVTRATLGEAQIFDPAWQAMGGLVSRRNDGLRENLKEYIRTKLDGHDDLIAKVTPDYAPLARRLVVDNGWYDALLRPNVDLVDSGIDHIEADAIVTTDGTRIECDALVLATGFEVENYTLPAEYFDPEGNENQSHWTTDGPRAYAGIEVPWMPNFFMMYGPNAQGRGGSFITLSELWADYIGSVLAATIESGKQYAVIKRSRYESYNAAMDRALGSFIWKDAAPAGKNYYVNSFGRQNVNMPWSLPEYMDILWLDPKETHDFE